MYGKENIYVKDKTIHSHKLRFIYEMVTKSIENDEQIIISSQFTSLLDIIQKFLYNNGYTTLRLDGRVPPVQRYSIVKDFNSG